MKLPFRLPSFSFGGARRRRASTRLLPALMATIAAILALKTVALAQDIAETAGAPSADASHPEGAADPAAAQGAQCATPGFAEQAGLSQAEVQVLQALGARRQALEAREGELSTGSELIGAAEQRLETRIAELRRLETSVSALLGQLDEQQALRLTNLVDVYQRMRAKDAAAVFDTLDEDTLVLVASRMRQQNLAEVMGRMDPQRARRLTQLLAELSRNTQDAEALMQNASAPAAAAAPVRTAAATPRPAAPRAAATPRPAAARPAAAAAPRPAATPAAATPAPVAPAAPEAAPAAAPAAPTPAAH